MGEATIRLFTRISSSLVLFQFLISIGVEGIEFSVVNNCNHSIWPAILANPVSPRLEQTGFELPTNTSRTLQVPNPWVGQIWARNGCKFDKSGFGSCATGNCASGKIECEGAVDASPATLVDFTLGPGAHNSYDVSLVYGFNLPVIVVPLNGTGTCRSAGCKVDLNLRCPTELRAANGLACKSSCIAFGTPDHCCRGAFGLHDTCKPSNYSVIFKSACPRSLIIGYSDTKSTFSCRGADYRIAFCPSNAGASKKSAKKFTSAASITTEEPERTGSETLYSVSKFRVVGSPSFPGPHE